MKPPTQKQLASLLGISQQLVHEHVKGGKAPPIADVPAWIEYLNNVGREGSAPADIRRKIAEQRLKILQETSERLVRDNAVGRKELISLPEAERRAAEAEAYYFDELDRAMRELPTALCGMDANQIADRLAGFFGELKVRSREKFKAVAMP